METSHHHHHRHQKTTTKDGDLLKQEDQSVKKHGASLHSTSTCEHDKNHAIPLAPASPPSSTTSPSHEFSFTISLQSSSTTHLLENNNNKSKTPPNSFAIDLSPADDIFFHGHLLPLHLLAHLPVSPRSTTNSLDSFTLPVKDLFHESNSTPNFDIINQETKGGETKGARNNKSKPFSLFKWRKTCDPSDEKEKHNNKKKLKFDVSHVIKRYVRMVRPFLFFKGRKENNVHFNGRQAYSFSGNVSMRNKRDQLRGRRGEFSAPASMRTSPTNSGLLVATTTTSTLPSPTSDSTMEELQAAIQAAIAHCKNSFSVEDNKLKC